MFTQLAQLERRLLLLERQIRETERASGSHPVIQASAGETAGLKGHQHVGLWGGFGEVLGDRHIGGCLLETLSWGDVGRIGGELTWGENWGGGEDDSIGE